MGKKLTSKPGAKSVVSPDCLTMNLFSPGMTILHRAGLGGLVGSLRYIERAANRGEIDGSALPGGPWHQSGPPWTITEQTVTLHFGPEANAASDYFCRLFAISFSIRDGLVYMPGQYGALPPSVSIRAALQDGLLLTFYDHGPQSRGLGGRMPISFEIDGATITIDYPRMEWYKHQREGARLAIASCCTPQALSRSFYPGAVERHAKYSGATSITNGASLLVPLLFAPVGCFALRMGGRRVKIQGKRIFKAGGAIIMPDFTDLLEAPSIIGAFTPHEVRETRVLSLGDAALGAELRLRAANLLSSPAMTGVRAVWCCAADWNSKMQPVNRMFWIDQSTLSDHQLNRYASAVASLGSRIFTNEEGVSHWIDSVVRPLVADNLALGRPWYQDFTRLMVANDGRGRPIRDQLRFEQGGLQTMISDPNALTEAERILVCSMHQAIRNNLGRIRQETDGSRPLSQATKNRWKRFRERLRLALVGAKTSDQCRNAICTLFANAGVLKELKDGWQIVVPMLRDSRWMFARDLALLALASYARQDEDSTDEAQS
jgi:CRISPR-associated protein Cas8a1/Csx13